MYSIVTRHTYSLNLFKCYVSFHYLSVCQFLAKINYLAFVYCAPGYCSHIVGLIYTLELIKAQQSPAISCTSLPQQRHKPRGSKIKDVPISSIVIAKARCERKRKPIDCCYRGSRYDSYFIDNYMVSYNNRGVVHTIKLLRRAATGFGKSVRASLHKMLKDISMSELVSLSGDLKLHTS